MKVLNDVKWVDFTVGEKLYQISSEGVIRFFSGRKYSVKKVRVTKGGYENVRLTIEGQKREKAVHRLVAIAFIPNPQSKRCVNHIDGDKRNNRVGNLEWCTHSENSDHASRTGLLPRGYEHPHAKFTRVQIKEIRRQSSLGVSAYKMAKNYNVNKKTMEYIVENKSYVVQKVKGLGIEDLI